ncbi:MAG: 23S rRNA (uracil(1939)-C(5))-methyltransferase RlmD, partial [Lachnospiraceae bacterium]|nr:23S rRNA (uracil(1939)-C(5))-methyltransferase RlmD [Lachnospiraceae bacterium]
MEKLKKNEMVRVRIEDMGHDGAGIGRVDGYALFVKDALIGDLAEVKVMKAKKNYAYARLMRIVEPSPFRVEPRCPVSRQCGGCQLQAMDYEQQLLFKQRKVENNLKRIGGFENLCVQPVLGMEEPFRYRNKAQFPIGTDKEGHPVAGFYAGRTHSIISCTDCLLGHPVNEQILDAVLNYMERFQVPAYDEQTGKGLVRHVLVRVGFSTKELMVCLVLNGRKLPKQEILVEELTKIEGMTSITINVNTERSNVILGRELIPVWGQTYLTDYIGDLAYQISPLSFYQVNPAQTRKLYETALSYAGLTGKETVWDLYCGIGTISLFLARKAKKVYGVEIIPQAIEDARKNAARNGITNAEFFVGKSEEILPEYYRKNGGYADVIVVDPPRKGCEEALLETIVKMQPARVVYVSCDSATLARDLKYLCGNGFRVEKVQPVDMFG